MLPEATWATYKTFEGSMLIAVLDANVLFPMVLRDTLLCAAEAGCYRLQWSARILEEVMGSLVRDRGIPVAKATALRATMEEAFPEAIVDPSQKLEDEMRVHVKDRHVAAAAVACGATHIVTLNVRDFRDLPEGTVAVTPDQFLLTLMWIAPEQLTAALMNRAARYRRPRCTFEELLASLSAVVPTFVAEAAGSTISEA